MNYRRELLFFITLLSYVKGNTNNASWQREIARVTLFKCTCSINEAIKDGKCTPAPNKVSVWENPIDYVANLTQFGKIVRRNVICEEGYSKIDTGEAFLIYTNGLFKNLLIDGSPPQKNYCVEFIKATDGNITVSTEVCTENPKISSCCPVNYTSNQDGYCVHDPYTFRLPFKSNIIYEKYPIRHVDISCRDGQVMKRENLSRPYEVGASLTGYPLGRGLSIFASSYSTVAPMSSDEYCIRVTNIGDKVYHYEAEFCIPDPMLEYRRICENATCVKRCCPQKYRYHQNYSGCYLTNTPRGPTLHNLVTDRKFKVVVGFPLCEEFYSVDLKNESKSMILSDGSLTTSTGLKRESAYYCLNEFIGDDNSIELIGLVCFPNKVEPCKWRWIAGSICLGISCIFYLATIIIYISVPELRNKIFGKCLISEVSSLLVAYLTLIFLQNTDSHKGVYCSFPGTVEHISVLASFFWLNVMCFDMWSTFRSVRPAGDTRRDKTKRFIWYNIYAWGVSFSIGMLRLIIDSLPIKTGEYEWLIMADFGDTHCFFSGNYSAAKWAYLYGPILILLIMNLFFFLHVALILVRMHKERVKLLSEGSSRTGKSLNKKKDRIRLYLKLFIVMGISWIIEIIMWFAVPETDCFFWGLDIVNMLQGVFIFFIFVYKKSTLRMIRTLWEESITPPDQRHELAQLPRNIET